MATTSLALILAGICMLLADSILFRQSLKQDLSALARIIADNTTGALAFDDSAAATETLAALRARPHVMAACVFDQSGVLFARYVRAGFSANCPPPETADVIRFERGAITVGRPIILKGARLGTLVLLYSLDQLYERIQIYGVTVTCVFLLSTLVALLLSASLRSLVTEPIIELARVSAQVSSSRDYALRARKTSGDELGLLVDAFNEMLSGIQSRDGELRTSNENLARSNEDLERFAFIASHDLQEPLRMIAIYSQLLVRSYSGNLDPKASSFIDNIQSGTRRMRELLADLLAYAEVGARFELPSAQVDLNKVVEKARENLALAISESGAVISAAPLPVISGYESHFIPLFQNLIGNAIKYRGDQPCRIDIAASTADNYCQIRISDNGIGIAPEYHAKIFVAFKRLHGNKIPGTGIGLAICQRVVERYGGRIWVESELGVGSSFFFTLPAQLLVAAEMEER
jgi:signal transduction histidine kinase